MVSQSFKPSLAMAGLKWSLEMIKELNNFLNSWQTDPLQSRPAFKEFYEYLESLPNVSLNFKARPGISYSLRAKNAAQKNRELFVLVDVVDDDPASRWLSVCFYADMVSDPEQAGDMVPGGLLGEDAICFNLDEDDPRVKDYILSRLKEAAQAAGN